MTAIAAHNRPPEPPPAPPAPAPAFSPEQIAWLKQQLSAASERAEAIGLPAHQDVATWLRYRMWRAGVAVIP